MSPPKNVFRSDAEMVTALRAAAAELPPGTPLTCAYYRDFAMRTGAPSSSIVCVRYESWARICRRAGVPHNPPLVSFNNRRKDYITKEQCIAAVLQCSVDLGGGMPLVKEYTKWARANGSPCVSIVRRRVVNGKGWRAALRVALGG
jgi:hypothetical protein